MLLTICEISSNMIISYVFATNHLVKTLPHVTIMEHRKKEKKGPCSTLKSRPM